MKLNPTGVTPTSTTLTYIDSERNGDKERLPKLTYMFPASDLAEGLQAIRNDLRYTDQQMADLLGISPQHYRGIESGLMSLTDEEMQWVELQLLGARKRMAPTVVCLCGSTRFYKTFMLANYQETLAGRIVLSVGFYPHAAAEMHGEGVGITEEQKKALDELHKCKIDKADEILVLDVPKDGVAYIGESTRSEIEYATAAGKKIRYWSAENPNYCEQ